MIWKTIYRFDSMTYNKRQAMAIWSNEDTELFVKNYPNNSDQELFELFEGRYTVNQIRNKRKRNKVYKSDEYLAKRGMDKDGKFMNGITPFNKGKKHDAGGRSHEFRFKKGSRPPNHRPVGSTRLTKDGYVEIKVADGMSKWRLLHREVWKDNNGNYPPDGHAIVFIDGNQKNCDISNLKLVTRAELMQMNTVHRLPKYLAELIQLNGQLKRRIDEQR